MTHSKKKQSAVRRVAEATLDVAVGGSALAADKAIETLDKLTDRAESAAGRARQAASSRDGRAYEDRTRDELYELASERDIPGRSSMNKAELIGALRAKQ